jgi:putative transposase
MIERKSPRMKGYDYSIPHYYFVTICSHNRKELFGSVIQGKVFFTAIGKIINESWQEIVGHFTNVELDEYIIMPNHFHAIIILAADVGLSPPAGAGSPQPNIKTNRFSLSQIIAYFKHESVKRINELLNIKNVWQRSFYDRIIRSERELYYIRNYIRWNAAKWEDDIRDENLEL